MWTHGNPLTDYSPEMETFGFDHGGSLSESGVFNQAEEVELASQLLEVSSDPELEQFLGDLISKAGKAIGGFIKSPVGKAIGRVLKGAAKVALPIAGGALGTMVGGPLGTRIGSSLGSGLGQALGLELEGLSPEDREFEAARQFVRFAGETVKNALEAPDRVHPAMVAEAAATEAAREFGPGLINQGWQNNSGQEPRQSHHRRHGTWTRNGNSIILFEV